MGTVQYTGTYSDLVCFVVVVVVDTDKTSETKLRRQIKVASIIWIGSRYCRSENNHAEMPNYSGSCQLQTAKGIHVDSKETRNTFLA